MGFRKALRKLVWSRLYRCPRLYFIYNHLIYPKAETSVSFIGIDLAIKPVLEPTYFKTAKAFADNHAVNGEIPKIAAMCALLRPGSLFVDCGANTGLWSASVARLTPLVPGLAILAFEANPDTFGRLSRTAAAYPNIRCVNIALSDRQGEIEMSEGGSSLVFGVAGVWNRGGRTHRLPAMPLDPYLEGHGDILLKIDAEGHDWPVLAGARRAVEEGRVRVILIDGFPAADEQKIGDLLRAGGFAIFVAGSLKTYTGGTMPILAVRTQTPPGR